MFCEEDEEEQLPMRFFRAAMPRKRFHRTVPRRAIGYGIQRGKDGFVIVCGGSRLSRWWKIRESSGMTSCGLEEFEVWRHKILQRSLTTCAAENPGLWEEAVLEGAALQSTHPSGDEA